MINVKLYYQDEVCWINYKNTNDILPVYKDNIFCNEVNKCLTLQNKDI